MGYLIPAIEVQVPPALPENRQGRRSETSMMMRCPIDENALEIRILTTDDAGALRSFSCDDEDLDDFFQTDALRLQQHNVVRTFVAIYEDKLVGCISLMTDAIVTATKERKQLALNSQDHPVISGLKIARLAVSASFRADYRGMGKALVRFAQAQVLVVSKHAGCRLLTVDAYPQSISFYEQLGFRRSRAKDYRDRELTSLWFDVLRSCAPADISEDPSTPVKREGT